MIPYQGDVGKLYYVQQPQAIRSLTASTSDKLGRVIPCSPTPVLPTLGKKVVFRLATHDKTVYDV